MLKERHQSVAGEGLSLAAEADHVPCRFIRTNDDPSTLSWEDQLALKYYNSLFREYAIVNLKHYKTGQASVLRSCARVKTAG